MAGEPNTAEKQNAIRREQKRKQRTGRKKNRNTERGEEVKLSRHVQGDWSASTKTQLSSLMMEKGYIITSRNLVRLMLDGKLSVIVTDEDNPLINGKEFFVTKEGFKDAEENPPGYMFYSVTVPVGNGYGYQMRWDRSERMFVN